MSGLFCLGFVTSASPVRAGLDLCRACGRMDPVQNIFPPMIDADGFRPNVGIVVLGPNKQVLWAKRVGQDAWQFPQGGIQRGESPEDALYRELHEELGLKQHDVEVMGCTQGWLRYRLPLRYIRRNKKPLCIGQKQKWFLRLVPRLAKASTSAKVV